MIVLLLLKLCTVKCNKVLDNFEWQFRSGFKPPHNQRFIPCVHSSSKSSSAIENKLKTMTINSLTFQINTQLCDNKHTVKCSESLKGPLKSIKKRREYRDGSWDGRNNGLNGGNY